MTDLSREEWYSMETKNTINGSREFDIFNANGDLIATVYPDAGLDKQELYARLVENVPEIYEQLSSTMNTINNLLPLIPDTVDTYDLQAEADLIYYMLNRIDGTEAHNGKH